MGDERKAVFENLSKHAHSLLLVVNALDGAPLAEGELVVAAKRIVREIGLILSDLEGV